jgi:hypothetical protein
MNVTIGEARRVKAKAGEIARGHNNVTGVGLTRVDGSYVIKVNLREPAKANLPRILDGVPILYEVTGPISARLTR